MLTDLMGMTDTDFMYNQQRAHSADIFFLKVRMWFWGSFLTLSSFLIGNILGVFDINIMGWMINFFKGLFH